MELQQIHSKHVVGIPIRLEDYTRRCSLSSFAKQLLPDHTTPQYQILPSPCKSYSKIRHNRVNSAITKLVKLRERVDIFARGIREHVQLGPKISETLKGKLRLGARIVRVGGVEKVFKKNFSIIDGEKLLSVCQCYVSTTEGPIAGLLFVSSERVAFCSDRSIKVSSTDGKILKLHYKVMIPLKKIRRAVESENVKNPKQKYVEIVTHDSFEFWFMGFFNHLRMLRYLQQAIYEASTGFWATELV